MQSTSLRSFSAAPLATGAQARPVSAVPTRTAAAGVAGFVAGLALTLGLDAPTVVGAPLLALSTALPMMALEWLRCGQAAAEAADARERPARMARLPYGVLKLLGMFVTAAPFVAFHTIVARLDSRQEPAMYAALAYALWAALTTLIGAVTAPPGKRPADAAFRLGRWVLRKQSLRGDEAVLEHYRVWALKLFFVPFLVAALPGNIQAFADAGQELLAGPTWARFVRSSHFLFYLLDVTVGLIGYLLTVRLFGSQVRSTNAQRSAWLFCLICYPPFWPAIHRWLDFGSGGLIWDQYFYGSPLIYVWGAALLLLEFVYVWATLAFGIRFSNLTNRGIITNGPYRFAKHPAYLAKNISWWLWYLPFISAAGFSTAVVDCLQLALVNLIYFMRAKTEEQHLREDPAYREYEAWMRTRAGSFRRRIQEKGRRLPA